MVSEITVFGKKWDKNKKTGTKMQIKTNMQKRKYTLLLLIYI